MEPLHRSYPEQCGGRVAAPASCFKRIHPTILKARPANITMHLLESIKTASLSCCSLQ